MCGIVLAGGNLTSSDLDIFNQLIYCDVFRGQHSTGVFGQRKSSVEVFTYKEALPSYAFMLKDEYVTVTSGEGKYVNAPSWIVGHNRHATRGAVNARNAHPFKIGNITLVHNGTLTDQTLLPDHLNYEVDSENICHSINELGAAATIQKLDGAFTLIWHDAKDNTLHIIRNDKRPFHLARCNMDWFGASEEDMLMWILKRSASHKNRVSEHFECKIGVEYIFDVSNNKMTLTEEVEHKLPVFTLASRWGDYWSNGGWQNNYQDERFERHKSGNTGNKSAIETGADIKKKEALNKQNKIASDKGVSVRRDQIVSVTPHMFTPYHNNGENTIRGKMTCYLYEEASQEYIEADVHNVSQADYEAALNDLNVVYSGTVACINEINSMIRLVLTPGRFINMKDPKSNTAEFDDDIPFDMGDSFINKQGVEVTRKFWEAHAHGECGGCGKHIEWKDAPKAPFAYQCYWHEACLTALSTGQMEGAEDVEMAVCSICGHVKMAHEFDDAMSESRKEDICLDCAEEIRKKVNTNSIERGFVWTRAIDMTNPRHPEIATCVDAERLRKMVIMGESKKKGADLTLADVPFCRIEKRAGGIFAIGLLEEPSTVSTVKEVEVQKDEPFLKRENKLELKKIVRSLDGKREYTYTKALWASLGYCEFCYKHIPWRDAEVCSLGYLNRVVCSSDTCKEKLVRQEVKNGSA